MVRCRICLVVWTAIDSDPQCDLTGIPMGLRRGNSGRLAFCFLTSVVTSPPCFDLHGRFPPDTANALWAGDARLDTISISAEGLNFVNARQTKARSSGGKRSRAKSSGVAGSLRFPPEYELRKAERRKPHISNFVNNYFPPPVN